jgi:hypothetical protein
VALGGPTELANLEALQWRANQLKSDLSAEGWGERHPQQQHAWPCASAAAHHPWRCPPPSLRSLLLPALHRHLLLARMQPWEYVAAGQLARLADKLAAQVVQGCGPGARTPYLHACPRRHAAL